MTSGQFVLGLMASCARRSCFTRRNCRQVPLRVTHTHNGTVTMKYVPVNMRGKVSYYVQIPSEKTVAFVPQGQGPYDVHCYINREDSFQQKVSVRKEAWTSLNSRSAGRSMSLFSRSRSGSKPMAAICDERCPRWRLTRRATHFNCSRILRRPATSWTVYLVESTTLILSWMISLFPLESTWGI